MVIFATTLGFTEQYCQTTVTVIKNDIKHINALFRMEFSNYHSEVLFKRFSFRLLAKLVVEPKRITQELL